MTEQNTAVYRKNYQPPAFLVETTDLHFELKDSSTVVTSKLAMRRNPDAPADKNLELDGEELKLVSLSIDGRVLTNNEYQIDGAKLIVPNVPNTFTLECVAEINPAANTALEGLYKDSGGMFCTQCEAEGFRRITYYPDRPDVLSKFTVTIVADKTTNPVLLSNGNLVDSGDMKDGKHFAKWEDPLPKPSYLFALVAGEIECIEDTFTTMEGRKVTLRIYTEAHNVPKCGYAMGALKRSMKWDEDAYGRVYDLDIFNIVAVDSFNMGAMENTSLNIFNSKYVLGLPETTTDRTFMSIEGIIGHEFFHHWSGNHVTCRSWFELSLKEGFTVFRDSQFSGDMNSTEVKRIEDVRTLRSAQFPEDAGPLAHAIRLDVCETPDNFYSTTVYEKGAEVIRMMHVLLGADRFRKGSDLYFKRHDGEAVTCDDFVQAMADANADFDLDWNQFKLWYSQAGTPVLEISGKYDETAQTFTMTVKQSCPPTPGQPTKEPFYLPLKMGLLDSNGNDMSITLKNNNAYDNTTGVLHITQESETFVFTNVTEKPVPSLLRGFSAPVKLMYPYSRSELTFLMTKDTDGFNRWEAGQMLAVDVLMDMIDAHQAQEPMNMDPRLVQAMESVLDEAMAGTLDKSLAAEALILPTGAYLGELMGDSIDLDGIEAARKFAREELAKMLQQKLVLCYNDINVLIGTKAYEASHEQIGQRSLRNTCLDYLMTLNEASIVDLCVDRLKFGNCSNMTDILSALRLLVNSGNTAEADKALADFYTRWKADPLVLEQWFAVQAGCSEPGTLQRAKKLMQHEAFSLKRPNTVRAVIGAFTGSGVKNFHSPDGSGYVWLADRIIEVDAINPQIAARLVAPLSKWKRYDANRKKLIKAELERILAVGDKLSRNTREIVSKSLA